MARKDICSYYIKFLIQWCIVAVIGLHIALMALSLMSWPCGIWGLAMKILYAQLIVHFPLVQVRSRLFLSTCGKQPSDIAEIDTAHTALI